MARRLVDCFVSYAHDDHLAADLLDRLWLEASPSRRHQYQPWSDRAILPGESWDERIRAALVASHIGLLLVSPAFLASQYIQAVELPALLGPRPVIPVLLAGVDPRRHDLRGLERLQLFGLRRTGSGGLGLRSYRECTGRQRDRFVTTLFEQIEDRLERLWGATP